MTEESMMILGLLRDGKISASEAERLLRTVRETGQKDPPIAPKSTANNFGQTAQSAARLAGKAWGLFPKPKIDTSKITDKVGEAAGDALRAARSAAQDVASEVSKISGQTRQVLRFDGTTSFTDNADRPSRHSEEAEALETSHTEITWEGAERLLLTNSYGNIQVVGQEAAAGLAQATVKKAGWASTEAAARLLLQQTFLVTRVENGVCHVEVIAPRDAGAQLTVDYQIMVPRDVSVEIQTTFGTIDADGVSPALIARSISGRLALKHPFREGSGEARVTTSSGDILIDSWSAAAGSMRVETVSGDVEVQEAHCDRELTLISRSGDISITDSSSAKPARIETQSGDVRLTRVRTAALGVETMTGAMILRETSGSLTLKTSGGNIVASEINTPAVSLNTGSGDARIAFAAPFSGSLAGTSVSGNLSIALWDNSDTRIDLHTTSGSLECSLPLSNLLSEAPRHLSGKLGEGIGSIRLQSVSGDLKIEKESAPKKRSRSKAAP